MKTFKNFNKFLVLINVKISIEWLKIFIHPQQAMEQRISFYRFHSIALAFHTQTNAAEAIIKWRQEGTAQKIL